MSTSRRTSDREELIAKKEHLLFQDYRHDFPLRTFQFTDKIDRFRWLVRTHWWSRNETSRVVNEPITSISKNNRLLWK